MPSSTPWRWVVAAALVVAAAAATTALSVVHDEAALARLRSSANTNYVLIAFLSTEDCSLCDILMPILSELAGEQRAKAVAVVRAANDATALRLSLKVHRFPTLLLFKHGFDEPILFRGEYNVGFIRNWLKKSMESSFVDDNANANAIDSDTSRTTTTTTDIGNSNGDTVNNRRQKPPHEKKQKPMTFLQKAQECEEFCDSRRDTAPECDYVCIDESCFYRVWNQDFLDKDKQKMDESGGDVVDLGDGDKVAAFTRCAKLRLMPAIPSAWRKMKEQRNKGDKASSDANSGSVYRQRSSEALEQWKRRVDMKKQRRREEFINEQQESMKSLDERKQRRRQEMKQRVAKQSRQKTEKTEL